MNAYRRSQLSVAVTAALVLSALPLTAQAQEAESKDAKTLDRVEVTGSRIKTAQLVTQSPVFTMTRKDIDRTGLTSIGDVIAQLTSSGGALNAKFNSSGNFGSPPSGGGIGAGSSQVDLRHLGSNRVLVLVDGLRWVNESSASGVGGSADLNTIPMSIVDRIEVLQDGASTIYGSDAIAGVVNIITKHSFDGAEIVGYYGDYDKSGGGTTKGELTVGGGNDRFDAIFNASYNDQKAISSATRAQASVPVPGTGLTRGSSGTPQGRFIFCDPSIASGQQGFCDPGQNFWYDLTLNNGTGTPVFDPANPTGGASTYHGFGGSDRFNFAPFNLLLTPNERKSMFTTLRFKVNDSINWYGKALYNRRESTNQAAPEPIFIGSDAGTGGLADTISISRLNPFNPFGIDLVAGENFSLIGRRPIEAGPRIFDQQVDTYYFATGFQGDFSFGDRLFSWDVNYINSENSADQIFRNGFNLGHLKQGLGDPAVCAATPGCVPVNLFGGQGANGEGTLTPEMLNWIRVTTKDSSKQTLEVFSANLTGDLFELPAGMMAFAGGFEHRKNGGSFSPDQIRVSGESQDSVAVPTSGSFNVDEAYLELSVPLLADVAMAKNLDLSLAGRYSNYSNFGTEYTGKVGLRWQIVDDLVVRGTYSEGLRAPFIGELFGLGQFGPTLTDPCSNQVNDADGPNTTPTETNCRTLGVPSGYEQINTQITTTTGGNANLSPESSDSYTAGLVYSPSWAENTSWATKLDFEATFYRHVISDAIQAPDAQNILDACVDDPGSVFCDGITRTPGGQINRFDNRLANIGKITTEGYDFRLYWVGPELGWGQLSVDWAATIVDSYKATDIFGNTFSRTVGVEVNDNAIPEWQSNVRIGWSLNDFNATWTMRYISAVTESCSDFRDDTSLSFANLGLCTNPNLTNNALSTNRLGAVTYHDVQASWVNSLGVDGLTLSAGVNNVFDKDPPICLSCSLNGYDAATYDLPGKFAYVQATYRF